MADNEIPDGWDPILAIQKNDQEDIPDFAGLLAALCQSGGSLERYVIEQNGLLPFVGSLVRDYKELIKFVRPDGFQLTPLAFEISKRVEAANEEERFWQQFMDDLRVAWLG